MYWHRMRPGLAAMLRGAIYTLGALGATASGAAEPVPAPTPSPTTTETTPTTIRRPPPAQIVADYTLTFPRDHGSHPDFRTEWWYVTGWLDTAAGETLGFQVTFFRTRPDAVDVANPSRFTPGQLVIAHAAISDPRHGRLWKAQRVARAGFGIVAADESDTQARLDDWHLQRQGERYETRIATGDFGFELVLARTQPPMLNGRAGFSQKGPQPQSASRYYSVPQLQVSGEILRQGRRETVRGSAWLDHEWSSAYLDADATGWDWIGINLDDGGALMAFRIRGRDGGTHWAGGTLRRADGTQQILHPEDVAFTPGRRWRSPRTGVEYPVEFAVRAGPLQLQLAPLMDDQESDTRGTTGAIYWEGAMEARQSGRRIGRGYLELTGYGAPLELPGADSAAAADPASLPASLPTSLK
ncbi:MAG: carotenoid 1,2-hydratase [Sinobacteraceae bacterium]|nr:carotenoid 1,2-hydratase [Nevskiaceae bacterium]MCP5339334.1 carotenoid 1,2-hydratase [Nevskiaceae bacterium]MCP5471385.1 carotenoid 1,2-hydratase [Nevskiaceae bacterium]